MPDKLSDLLKGSLGKHNAGRTVLAAMTSERVERVIGEVVPAAEGKVRCTKVKEGVACVSADTSMLAEDIRLNESLIIETLREGDDASSVMRIRIVA